MPAPRSSPGSSKPSGRSRRATGKRPQSAAAKPSGGAARKPTGRTAPKPTGGTAAKSSGGGVADGIASFVEQLTSRILKPLGIVMLTRDRIQETLDEAAARGRLTRSDANELATELVNRGREQTDELMSDLERLFGRGREQIGAATRRAHEPVDRIVRTAERARRTIVVGPSFPIAGYDDLTARQVEERLVSLSPGELRKVRDYELRHANRKSVLSAIERSLP
jgi:polyhydroxyalkanoate synthesis regulator phasin